MKKSSFIISTFIVLFSCSEQPQKQITPDVGVSSDLVIPDADVSSYSDVHETQSSDVILDQSFLSDVTLDLSAPDLHEYDVMDMNSLDMSPDAPESDIIDAQQDVEVFSDETADPGIPLCEKICGGKQCGDDGCGGSCGSCEISDYCTVAGQCIAQPEPETLAQNQANPTGIAVYEDFVYWANKNDGTLNRTATNGTQAVEILYNAAFNPWSIAVDETRLFWTDTMEGSVRFMAKTGGPSLPVSNLTSVYQGLALSNEKVFWASALGSIWASPKVNASPTELISGLDNPDDLAYRDGALYWTDRAQGSVNRFELSTGESTALAVLQEEPIGITVDATHVYWTTLGSDAIRRATISGGQVTQLANGQGDPFRIVVDAIFAYWTSATHGQILRVQKNGGAVEVIADNQGSPAFITATDTHLYWTNQESGKVMRIQK